MIVVDSSDLTVRIRRFNNNNIRIIRVVINQLNLTKIVSRITKITWTGLSRYIQLRPGWSCWPAYSLSRIYIVWPVYREFLNSEKNSWNILAGLSQNRFIERPVYRGWLCTYFAAIMCVYVSTPLIILPYIIVTV